MIEIEFECDKSWKILLILITVVFILFLVRLPPFHTVSALPRFTGNGDNYTSPSDDFTILLTDETLPPSLGKNMSVLIRNLTETHKENLLLIKLRRRLLLNETWSKKLDLLNRTRCEMKAIMEERQMEKERLREMLRQGNITREEFIMEMNRLDLEIKTSLNLLKETSKEAQKALQGNISEENKRLAKQIVEENNRFQQEMKQLHEAMKEEIKQEKKENKGKGSGKN